MVRSPLLLIQFLGGCFGSLIGRSENTHIDGPVDDQINPQVANLEYASIQIKNGGETAVYGDYLPSSGSVEAVVDCDGDNKWDITVSGFSRDWEKRPTKLFSRGSEAQPCAKKFRESGVEWWVNITKLKPESPNQTEVGKADEIFESGVGRAKQLYDDFSRALRMGKIYSRREGGVYFIDSRGRAISVDVFVPRDMVNPRKQPKEYKKIKNNGTVVAFMLTDFGSPDGFSLSHVASENRQLRLYLTVEKFSRWISPIQRELNDLYQRYFNNVLR